MLNQKEKIDMSQNGTEMKIVCICDHFMEESFYTHCLENFTGIRLLATPYFGAKTRKEMRCMVHEIESKGPYAYEPPAEVFEAVKDADLIMTHLCPIPRELMQAAPNLKYILLNRGGTENVDLKAAKEMNIPVLNNPAHNGNAVAELTIGHMICETRNIARAHMALKNGEWREKFPNVGQVYELRGKTIGLIGFGTIGRLVAEKLMPFHVNVIATDPAISPDDPDVLQYNVTLTDLETVMKESDIVSLHARNDNKEIILGKEQFDLMKSTAVFINTARAYMVDYDYLAKILKENRIMGAALEVFPVEPLPKDSPFISLDNVSLTNHRGGDTVNCYSDSPEYLLTQIYHHLTEGKRPKFFID